MRVPLSPPPSRNLRFFGYPVSSLRPEPPGRAATRRNLFAHLSFESGPGGPETHVLFSSALSFPFMERRPSLSLLSVL